MHSFERHLHFRAAALSGRSHARSWSCVALVAGMVVGGCSSSPANTSPDESATTTAGADSDKGPPSTASSSVDAASPTDAPSNSAESAPALSDSTRTDTLTTHDTTHASSTFDTTTSPNVTDTTNTVSTSESSTDTCTLTPPVSPLANGSLILDLRISSGSSPLELGASYVDTSDTPYEVSSFLFMLSTPTLETAAGESVDAVFVDAEDTVLPYGVFVLDASGPPSSLRLRAPVGEYTALAFELGAPVECQSGSPLGRKPPLDVGSPLYWSWGDTYMAVRLEGEATVADAATYFEFHLGPLFGTPLVASRISLQETLTATLDPAEPSHALVVDLGRVIAPRPEGETLGHAVVADWLILNLVDSAFSLATVDSDAL